ncbi:hypothetical protein Agabi119p4_7932 [Agaricus bisporus var. burnettii]|uniref:Uncharacterized protein n=1 Tax=Agaricus bisporus var. burnettii TaxID=192524 RepID=A0A8H7CAL3_AGABI|nr:hypothetical protein Agabi119p4_7932 [Agaricus bisporus var. burnettii]
MLPDAQIENRSHDSLNSTFMGFSHSEVFFSVSLVNLLNLELPVPRTPEFPPSKSSMLKDPMNFDLIDKSLTN